MIDDAKPVAGRLDPRMQSADAQVGKTDVRVDRPTDD